MLPVWWARFGAGLNQLYAQLLVPAKLGVDSQLTVAEEQLSDRG